MRYLVDPSIAISIMDLDIPAMYDDPESMGRLFRSLCLRDLRVYVQASGGTIFHYHDNTGSKVDFVITLPDGRWAAVDARMTELDVSRAITGLHRFRNKVDVEVIGEPVFMMVIVPEGTVRFKDGVHIVPIGCLRD